MEKWHPQIKKQDILYEDNHLIAINKKSGQLSQPDETNKPALSDYVKKYIADKYNKPGAVYLGSIHRLDQPATGVIIFARTSKAHKRMVKLFKERTIEKTYWALSSKRPKIEKGTIKSMVYQLPNKNIMKIDNREEVKKAKLAELDYELYRSFKDVNLIQVLLKTGRKHQIRLQLSSIGCPIIGDVKYGIDEKPLPDSSISLHARKLTFIHPVKNVPIEIIAPMPKKNDYWRFFKEEEKLR